MCRQFGALGTFDHSVAKVSGLYIWLTFKSGILCLGNGASMTVTSFSNYIKKGWSSTKKKVLKKKWTVRE